MSHGLFEIHDDQIDVDQIMERIQLRARSRPPAPPPLVTPAIPPPAPTRSRPASDFEHDLDALRANWDPASLTPPRTRLRWAKRVMLWAMTPFTRGQIAFNSGVLWAVTRQAERVSALSEAVQALETTLRQQHDESRAHVTGAEAAASRAEAGVLRLFHELDQVASRGQDRIAALQERLEGQFTALQERQEEQLTARVAALQQWAEEQLAARVGALQQGVETQHLDSLHQSLGLLESQEASLGRRHEALNQEVLLQKRRLELILREIRQKVTLDDTTALHLREHEARLTDHLAFLHEQSFRGSDEVLRARMEDYVPLFAAARARVGGEAAVFDVGPGRGTLLGLLQEAGIPARGVDLSEDMVQVCQAKGLEVTQGDGLEVLASVPDDSLLGVVALHVVEHLRVEQLMELVKLCHQKIRPGGLLVLETPNPTNLITAATHFHLDLTHLRPLHPLALAQLVEALGFVGVEVKYLHPPAPEERFLLTSGASGDLEVENENWRRLNDLLFGPRDYAVIASR